MRSLRLPRRATPAARLQRALLACLVALTSLALAACGTPGADPSASTATPASTSTPTSTATPGGAAGFPRSVAGSDGVRVTLAAPPARLVSLSPGLTEVLFAIGAGDRLVAVDRFSDFPAAAARLPRLEYSAPSPESALGVRPDLVIMVTRQRQQVQQFRDLRLNVLYLDEPSGLDAVLRTITLLGELTGHEAEAGALVATMTRRIDAVKSAVGTAAGPRVFYELSPDLYTAGPDTFIGSMLTLLRARNVAQGATSPFPQLSAEAVLAADPEVILLSDAASAKQTAESVAARPGWAGVAAVKTRRIYAVNPDLTNRPGPRIVDGLEAMARALYPDRFPAAPR